jgi:hypothetical protein
LDPDNLDFALAEDDVAVQAIPPFKRESSPARPLRQPKQKQQLMLGMTQGQLAVIAGLALALICVLAGLVYVVTTF